MVVAQQTKRAIGSVALQLLLQRSLCIIGVIVIIVVEGVVGGGQARGAALLIPIR